MRIKSRFNINGYEVLCRTCTISDRSFILRLFKRTIFKFISEYHIPNIKMFDERFYWDYKEKKILLRSSRRIGMFQLSERNNRLAITWLFLSEQYQGKGIAKYLMTYFEDIAKAKMKDLTAANLDAAVRTIAGSARSMGVNVEGVWLWQN